MKFVEKPNLPQGRVKAVAVGEQYVKLLEGALSEYGIKIIAVPELAAVSEPVRGHADMAFTYLGNGKLVADGNLRNCIEKCFECEANKSEKMQLLFGKPIICAKYPQEVAYNVLIIGNHAFHNLEFTDRVLLDSLKQSGYELHNVSQGYTKCSVCIVSENAAVTADRGICASLERAGVDALLIRHGSVEIEKYEYGFIGGASGKLSAECLAFSGNILTHPDGGRILDFIEGHGVKAVSLTKGKLCDVGSIIPIFEENT